jgi:hypothetical protein
MNGFNANPDPAFNLNADPDQDPDSRNQTNADPDSSRNLKTQEVEFLHEKYRYLKLIIGKKNHTYNGSGIKDFQKAGSQVYLLLFGKFLCSWIRIQE